MNFPTRLKLIVGAFVLGLLPIPGAKADTNYVITSPDFIYAVDGVTTTNPPGFFVNNCPPLTLYAGNTYTFTMEATAFHPMVVATNASTGLPAPLSLAYDQASPQDITTGVITVTLPATNFPSQLYYQCNVHGFYGVITVLPPPGPPANTILGISVTTNVVLISSGTTTTFRLVPQFSSNLVSGAWGPVPSFTNTFAGGTNYTVFDRLDPICGPNVFLRISQLPP